MASLGITGTQLCTLLKPLGPSQHYRIEGSKGGLKLTHRETLVIPTAVSIFPVSASDSLVFTKCHSLIGLFECRDIYR